MEDETQASECETETVGATPHTGRRQRFNRALERLDAEVAEHESDMPGSVQDLRSQLTGDQQERARGAFEVAAHEGDAELVCPVCNRPYALHGVGCPTLSTGVDLDPEAVVPGTGLSLGEPVVEPAEEARFGGRVRELWRRNPDLEAAGLRLVLSALAAAIDQDRDELRGWVREEVVRRVEEVEAERRAVILAELGETVRQDLRRQVEEAVERLRYPVIDTLSSHEEGDAVEKDVLDAEPFLAELDRIFGERPEEPQGWLIEKPAVASSGPIWWNGDGFSFDATEAVRFARQGDAEKVIRFFRGDGAWGSAIYAGVRARLLRLLKVGPDLVAAVNLPEHTEHEPAHDRRERQSARHEDREGRVEGVDR